MTGKKKSVELLAPAGNFDSLIAAVEAGADAVYLGGKHFNMRLHRKDMNFSDAELEKAITYAHAHDVRVYITINNLISDDEIDDLKTFLAYLEKIQPDAILVQDLAVIELIHEMNIHVPMHASVMMNVHNDKMIEFLKRNGIVRIVASREMTLDEFSVLKERTGMEIEYFVHGDMCMSEGGQCIHSGVLFGESSNRGRCLKPCRWPYKLIDEDTGDVLDGDEQKAYKLALKDMCMYRNLRDLITAGVYSFKIEGRMRPPEFVRRIVSIYRRAIDAYLADPAGYYINEADYKKLYDGRARDFTTAFALGKPTANDIGFDGSREPRFFSKAIKEAVIEDKAPNLISDFNDETDKSYHHLAVRVRDMNGLFAACDNGADDVYIGGEAYLPNKPWTLDDIRRAMEIAREYDVRVIVMTPRTTHTHELVEMRSFLTAIDKLRPAGISVGNIGMLELAAEYTCLPIQTDFALNIFNHEATKLLEENRVSMATASLELSLLQLRTLIASSRLPIEVIVHGAYESMICDHNIPAMSLPYDRFASESFDNHRYALLDAAGEKHPLRMDQYGRDHIYFAKDLCLYQYIKDIEGAASYRIEAQDYSPELTGKLTKLYRQVLDGQIASEEMQMKKLREIEAISPRKFGIGAFRFKTSM